MIKVHSGYDGGEHCHAVAMMDHSALEGGIHDVDLFECSQRLPYQVQNMHKNANQSCHPLIAFDATYLTRRAVI